jgi:aconitate hydratase
MNLTQKLIRDHLIEGRMEPGEEIGIRIDQTLTQDATGTLVMLELEAMGLDRVRTEISVQYVDHNLLEVDHKNADDHVFLESACRRFGVWYSRAGNGVSHPVHQQCFGRPGKTLLGSDSHTPSAGAIGMLAIGAGGLEVALAMAGRPFYFAMPKVWGIRLVGELPEWVSAKDLILEMLRRHDVDGAVGHVLEYYGPGLDGLSAMDRHVIANMGTELGATTTVFPSDQEVRRYLRGQQREVDWVELSADEDADYDRHEELNLTELEPLIAKPSSPGNVVPVREIAGTEIYQAYLGSSANPGYRDFAVPAEMVRGRRVHSRVSFDINPTSRQVLINLLQDKHLTSLLQSGGRLHQAGCNGCIGMGQAPATRKISLRTVPRNFPGRSGTREDQVYLVSPETAAASALTGRITDPRTLDMDYPRISDPDTPVIQCETLLAPTPQDETGPVAELEKGPNVVSLPEFEALPDRLDLPILLHVGDDISTDEIMPAGARVLPLRSNIPEISKFCFEAVDPTYRDRAEASREDGGHAIVAGDNYGQGSSREHAALAPRFLGLRLVIALSFARIHRQNLINFGVLPLTFAQDEPYHFLERGDVLDLSDLRDQLQRGRRIRIGCRDKDYEFEAEHGLSERQIDVLLGGGLINWTKRQLDATRV